MKTGVIFIAVLVLGGWLFLGVPVAPMVSVVAPARAYAYEGWEKEFHDACSRTDDAMTLSLDELKSLVKRCDALKPEVEKIAEPGRKIFLRRLQTCRDLYAFTLEAKEKR